MRQSCSVNKAIVPRQVKAHMGCHNCWRLGDSMEAHGKRRLHKAAEAIED
jgi:hypothetical protein